MQPEIMEYIDRHDDARRDLIIRLHELVMRLFPTCETRISFRMPYYKLGKGWVYLGYWKEGVSVYVGYLDALDAFKALHPRIKTGKGCINLKLKDVIPWEDVEQLIVSAMQRS